MRRNPQGYLWDIRDAAGAILGFIVDIDFETYVSSPLIPPATERKFEIIGEALNLLFKSNPEIARRIPEFEKIIAFRNLLIHGYAIVEQDRVWAIARDYLPELRRAVDELLGELGE